MKNLTVVSRLCFVALLATGLATVFLASLEAATADHGALSVAVAEPDIEAIVAAVGGNQVNTFSLFKGCILSSGLRVEPDAAQRLAKADTVVWTGFLRESAAINASLNRTRGESPSEPKSAVWIDVSKGASRVNVPNTTCFGYIDAGFVPGDPFFWLNPRNGSVIARNVARGLGNLRPDKRDYFKHNADAFSEALAVDMNRWKQQLSPLSKLQIFATLSGWRNFSKLGGPRFIVCKQESGTLPTAKSLVEQLRRMKADIVVVDPHTSPEYAKAFREEPNLIVIDVPSSIGNIPGAKNYSDLFENLIRELVKNASDLKQSAKM